MSPEKTITCYYDKPLHEFYGQFILQRGHRLGESLAQIINGKYIENENNPDVRILYTPLDKKSAEKMGIRDASQVYGAGVLEHSQHANKQMLHETPKKKDKSPSYYSQEFAERVLDSVLPGFTAFNEEQALEAFKMLKKQGYQEIRLKDPTASDMNGQYVVTNENELKNILKKFKKLPETGVVLEVNLQCPETISVGTTEIDGIPYSFIKSQKETTFDGRTVYGGGSLSLKVGNLKSLEAAVKNGNIKIDNIFSGQEKVLEAVKKTRAIFESYSILDPIIQRASFDFIFGKDANGNNLSGVADVSLRVSGSSAGELEAIKSINPQAIVQLTYNDSEPPLKGKKYMDKEPIVMSTEVKK